MAAQSSNQYQRRFILAGLLLFAVVAAIAIVIKLRANSGEARLPTMATQPAPGQTPDPLAPSASENQENGSAEHRAGQKAKEGEQSDGDEEESKRTDKPEWNRPRFEQRRSERHRMVRDQIAGRGIEDEDVLAAMRHVPRHAFVPDRGAASASAYADRPLPIGHGQTISQPYIVAFMTDKLQIEAGDKVLEIGTGSAYQAAVLSEITPHVYTIEIIEKLAQQAARRLDRLGYGTVKVKTGDGYLGWEQHAPFDAIIVTAAAGHVPPPLLKQLRNGGRMIIPVGGTYEVQYLILVTKDEEGELSSNQLMPVRFVPMTGRAQESK